MIETAISITDKPLDNGLVVIFLYYTERASKSNLSSNLFFKRWSCVTMISLDLFSIENDLINSKIFSQDSSSNAEVGSSANISLGELTLTSLSKYVAFRPRSTQILLLFSDPIIQLYLVD